MRRLLLPLAVAAALAAGAGAAAPARAAGGSGPEAVRYRPPVDAPVIDRFRPPAERWGSGNRGIDYGTVPGQPVLAAAEGEVTFAGSIAGDRHVVVLHADGLRTSYSFLADVMVRRGDRVAGGQPVGTASGPLHFGVRAGDEYLDPIAVFAALVRVRLVPGSEHPLPVGEERAALVDHLRSLPARSVGAAAGAARWLAGQAADHAGHRLEAGRAVLDSAVDLTAASLAPPWWAVLEAARWRRLQQGCTPAATAPPPPPPGRRLAVLVPGLGSSATSAAVYDVDTGALGYAPADVSRFSYRAGGGHTAADTQIGVDAAAAALAVQVRHLQAAYPGVPVDLIAHSQGGLVARAAVVDHGTTGIGVLATLGTPHQGADLATAGRAMSGSLLGRSVLAAAGDLAPGGIDPGSPSVRDLAEGSAFHRHLGPLPPDVRAVSIAAAHDVVVPSHQTRLAGAAGVVVDVPGSPLTAHDRLPGSPAATRELALALAGAGPTCRRLDAHLADVAAGRAAAVTADAVGLAGAAVLSTVP